MNLLEEHVTALGGFIFDHKPARPDGLSTENNFYRVNGIPIYSVHHQVQIDMNRLIRVYLVDILEFDCIHNFDLHVNMLISSKQKPN